MAGTIISGAHTSSITLTTTASNPVSVTGTISVTATSGVALTGVGGNSWTIANAGTIRATGGQGKGILLGSFATSVTNGVVTNQSGGLISASGSLGYGVFFYGPGSVTNLSGGTISAGHIAVDFNSNVGTIINSGVILATSNVAAYEREGGIITNLAGGTISGSTGVWFQYGAGTFTNAGTVIGTSSQDGAVLFNDQTSSNLLIVDPGAVFSGGINGGLGALQLASASAAGTLSGFDGTSITNFGTLQFDAGSKWTVVGNTLASGLGTVAITGFTAQDTIDLTNFAATSGTFASNALVLTNGTGAHATLHIQGAFSANEFQLSSYGGGTGTSIVLCFAKGTQIETPSGPKRVEDLAVGETVQAHFAGSAPIQWIGRRHLDCTRHPDPRKAWPVRVRAGAFGPAQPCRDLFLSPNHTVYADDVLIPIKCLINGTSVAQVPVDEITYYHVELPQHDVLLAEGLPTESYLDVGDRSNFANGDASARLFPDFATHSVDNAQRWEALGCAPLVFTGPQLEAVRHRVNELSGGIAPGAAA